MIAPLSTSTVTSHRPGFKWALAPSTDAAHVQICADRNCATSVAEFETVGSAGAAPVALAAGTYFWRAFGQDQGVRGTRASPVWEVHVGVLDTPVDSAWGTTLDLNGDGRADLVAADPRPDGTCLVYAYLNAGPGATFVPAQTWTHPGSTTCQVLDAGDVNGDGYSDLLVATSAIPGDTGTVDLYEGGPSGPGQAPAVTLRYTLGFGQPLAAIGDANGDGYADMILLSNNQAQLYLGSPGAFADGPDTTVAEVVATSLGTFPVGDINGDGYADVVIDESLYLGSASGPSSATGNLGASNSSFAPTVIAGAGDVNADGYADIVVGSNGQGAHVFLGTAAGISPVPAVTFAPPSSPTDYDLLFGASVGAAGDLNHDGYADLLVGDPAYGPIHVYLGGAGGPSSTPSATIPVLGQVSAAGDVTGDGVDDLLSTYAGGASVYAGSQTTPLAAFAFQLTEPGGANDNFGAVVASGGDVTHSGRAALLVEAPGFEGLGSTYVFTDVSGTPAYSLGPLLPPAPPGVPIAVGDVNGDGYDDVIALGAIYWGGASGLTRGGSAPGARGSLVGSAGDLNRDGFGDVLYAFTLSDGSTGADVYFGGPTGLPGSPSLTVSGSQFAAIGVADINCDGYPDLVGNGAGPATYLYPGGPSGLATSPVITPTGSIYLIAIAGDVNRDGCADVIGTTYGEVVIYLGSPAGLSASPAVQLDMADDVYPHELPLAAAAGDINGDGYADVVIAVPGSPWTAGVWLGGTTGYDNPSLLPLALPTTAQATTGLTVGGGDFNGDGYADIIVGDPSASGGSGAAYLYLGGPGWQGTAPVTLADPTGGVATR